MTHQEIIKLEDSNLSSVFLHFEGTFWKAYERSAFLLATRLKKNYAVLRKESKTLGRDTWHRKK